jgi:hypothetical protein
MNPHHSSEFMYGLPILGGGIFVGVVGIILAFKEHRQKKNLDSQKVLVGVILITIASAMRFVLGFSTFATDFWQWHSLTFQCLRCVLALGLLVGAYLLFWFSVPAIKRKRIKEWVCTPNNDTAGK